MVKFTNALYEKLHMELKVISSEASNILQLSKKSTQAIQMAIQQLKEFILTYSFKDETEEIRLFKEINPQFLSLKIYHLEVYAIEANKPLGSVEMTKEHYTSEIDRLRLYFLHNQVLYNYYRADKTNYDKLFFLRDANPDLEEIDIEMDIRFCTVHSYKVAKLQGYEMVRDYLLKAIYKLENPNFSNEGMGRKFVNVWSDKKAALVEVIRAMYSNGSINYGKGSINDVIMDYELIYNVDLSNHYRAFQNMIIRKKCDAPFLDELKDSYVKYVKSKT